MKIMPPILPDPAVQLVNERRHKRWQHDAREAALADPGLAPELKRLEATIRDKQAELFEFWESTAGDERRTYDYREKRVHDRLAAELHSLRSRLRLVLARALAEPL